MPQFDFHSINETEIQIALSTTADGSMLNREDYDDPQVTTQRQVFFAAHGLSQDQAIAVNVQYDDSYSYKSYRTVTRSDQIGGMDYHTVPVADALITNDPGVVLFLPLADCVGTVFYDPDNKVLMLSHLGRHSLEVQGGLESIHTLQTRYGTEPSRLRVWLTPAPSKASYSIWKLNNQSMKEATLSQLLEAGVSAENIIDHPSETDRDSRFYSHSEFLAGRRDEDGRYAVIAWLPVHDIEK